MTAQFSEINWNYIKLHWKQSDRGQWDIGKLDQQYLKAHSHKEQKEEHKFIFCFHLCLLLVLVKKPEQDINLESSLIVFFASSLHTMMRFFVLALSSKFSLLFWLLIHIGKYRAFTLLVDQRLMGDGSSMIRSSNKIFDYEIYFCFSYLKY